MRVLVTGATSGVGTNVAAALRARGDQVAALVRRTSLTDALHRLGCDMVEGDVTDLVSVRRAARGCAAVVHAAAKVGDWGPPDEFERVNVEGTRNVLRAAVDEGVGRLVHVSSVSVYGLTDAPELVETLPLRPVGTAYADTKIAAERAVLDASARDGLQAAIVRPCLVYGPHDRNVLPRLARLLRRRLFVYAVDPATPYNLVHVDHVVDVIARALEHPDAPGEAFNVSDGQVVSLGEIVEVVARRLGVPVPTRRVPTGVALAGARALELVWKAARASSPPPLTPLVVRVMARTSVVSCEKAKRVLGFRPHVATLEGVARACDALR